MSSYRLRRRPDIGDSITCHSSSSRQRRTRWVRLWETVKRLEPLEPDFVSVTYGAGGSTRERTSRTVARILSESELRPRRI